MNAKIEIVKITPKRAIEMLENVFEDQRPVMESYVDGLAKQMKDGDWRLSSDAILLVKGKVANGQHRLWAVVKSNTPAQFILMESDDEELYKVIDSGAKRTVSDVIHVENGNVVAAAVKLILGFKSGQMTEHFKGRLSRLQEIEFAKTNAVELGQCARIALQHYRQKRVMRTTYATALLYLGREKNRELAEKFISSVFNGDTRDDAAWDYREKLIKDQLSQAKMPALALFACGIKAMKSFFNGTRPAILKYAGGEEFPKF